MSAVKDKVKFHFIKGNFFRVVHVDGVFGGLSPTGDIFISVFSQRPPIPQSIVQPVNERGELGDELLSERHIKDGLVREIEVGLTVRPEVAESIIKWLQEKVDQYKAVRETTEREEPKKSHA